LKNNIKHNILVWGLGYVGSVTSACLSKMGYNVYGIDTSQEKVDLFKKKICPIEEPELEELIFDAIKNNKFSASLTPPRKIDKYGYSIICVGTPSLDNGSQNLSFLKQVCVEIGVLIKKSHSFHNVLVRSTVFPGTVESTVVDILEDSSGKIAGKDFGIVMNPEFLRESTAIFDFFNPPYTVIGAINSYSSKNAGLIYENINSDIYHVSLKEAEILKMVNNAFHATKISFANEIGRICLKLNIDPIKTMELVCADRKLNISKTYLKPGFAFGGSCLPKDLRAINNFGSENNLSLPLLEGTLKSNDEHIAFIINRLKEKDVKKFGIMGLSFKSGTDDLRESPTIRLIHLMIENGFDILIYDSYLNTDGIFGANKYYLMEMIPNYGQLITKNIKNISNFSKYIIISNDDPIYFEFCNNLNDDFKIIDLSKIENI
tara:strand:- start:12392 stop:13687 length:1296 start_codon:yes stop_codon:yes gene_type:complete